MLAFGIKVFECFGCYANREGHVMQRCVGNHAIERTLKFAHTAALRTRNILDDRGGYSETQQLGLGTQNCQAMLVLWRLNIGQQTPLKARAQAVLQAVNSFGWAV